MNNAETFEILQKAIDHVRSKRPYCPTDGTKLETEYYLGYSRALYRMGEYRVKETGIDPVIEGEEAGDEQ